MVVDLYYVVLLVSRIFVATWNVGGKSPPRNLILLDWLHSSSPSDIYVLGLVLELCFATN